MADKIDQSIVDLFQFNFKRNYPKIAYYMDPINSLDPVHDMDTEIPQTFHGFILYINRQEVECKRMPIKYTVKAKEYPGNLAMIGEHSTLLLMYLSK